MKGPAAVDDLIFDALAALAKRQAGYKLARDYYENRHRLVIPNAKLDVAFGKLLRNVSDNLCESVVDTLADRLRIDGWVVPEELEEAIEAIEERSSLLRVQGEAHVEAATAGDSYLFVWPGRDDKVRISAQKADQCAVVFDSEDASQRLLGVKVWVERKHVRVNAYWPDRTERYVAIKAGTRMPKKAADLTLLPDDSVVANEWDEVPMFHLPNNGRIGEPGRSELVNVYPLQDMLNKSLADMLTTGEFHAAPVRALIGAGELKDPVTGQVVRPTVSPGDVLSLAAGAKLDQFAAADLAGFLEEQKSLRQEIAVVSRTPLHLMNLDTGGNPPSGESRKTAERSLTDKAADRQTCFTDPWAGAMSLAVRMETRSEVPVVARPRWRPAETQTETERLDAAESKLRVGYSKRRVLLELGLPVDVVDEMLKDARTEADAAADRRARAFDAGFVA